MKSQEERKILKKIEELMGDMQALGPVMRGSVTMMGRRHKQPYFSVSINKKTKVMYLGDRRAAKAREYSQNYRKLMTMVDEMTLLQMELLKLEGP